MAHEYDSSSFVSQSFQRISTCYADCFCNHCFCCCFFVCIDLGNICTYCTQKRLSDLNRFKLIFYTCDSVCQLGILSAVHQVCRLDHKVLNTIVDRTLQRLIYVVDGLTVTSQYVVDDDLSSKCSSYGPIRISFCQSLLYAADICCTAIVEGCTKAYNQQLVLTDLILIQRIVCGCIACVQTEVIRIIKHLFLLIAQCIICCLCCCTISLCGLCPFLNLDLFDQTVYLCYCSVFSCCTCFFYCTYSFICSGSCCFRCA